MKHLGSATTSTVKNKKRTRLVFANIATWLVAFSLVFLIFFQVFVQSRATYSGYYEYMIPGSEQQLWDIFNDIGGIPNQMMHTVIGVTGTTDGTTLYYDHWEDGYDLDINNPGPTADETYSLDNGQVREFESNNIPVNPRGTAVRYDGRDRIILAGGYGTVSRASWGETTGTVLALAWEVFPTKPFLNNYVIPVGENLDAAPYDYADFDEVYVIVESTENNNTVQINDPSIPGIEVNVTLQKGQTTQLHHIDSGTTVTGTYPIQVHIVAADDSETYEARGFTAIPSTLWDNEYYNPVGGFSPDETDLYLFNPTGSPLTINYEDNGSSGSFSIPANGTLSYQQGTGHYVPANSGARLTAATNFWGVGAVDTEDSTYEWGFSLCPTAALTREYYLGWAPGTSQATPTSNGSPVFITATQDGTSVNVDYSPTDGIIDATYTVNRLQSQKIFDPDFENTGMHIIASAPIASVWGEDPDTAAPGNPYLDMGYTNIPLYEELVDPVIEIEKTADPTSVPHNAGETSTFTIVTTSRDYAVDDVDVFDTLPPTWTYVDDSTTITLPDTSTITGNAADPSILGQELSWDLDVDMAPDETLTVVFDAMTTMSTPAGVSTDHAKAIGERAGGAQVFSPEDTADVTVTPIADLLLEKTVDNDHPNVGGNVTFTVMVDNDGPDAATNVAVKDLLPAGLTHVSNTPSQGSYVPGTGIWTVGTINDGANATITIVAQVTAPGAYTNVAEVAASDVHDPDSTPNNDDGDQSEDDEDAATLSTYTIDLELEKNVNDPTPSIGSNVTFTLTLENNGPDTATNIAVRDLLSSGYTPVSNTPSQGTYVPGTGIWTVGSVNNGGSATLQMTATVNETGVYANITEVTAAGEFDSDSTPNNDDGDQSEDDEDAESVTPEPVIDLELEKIVNNATPNVGSNVTFTITVNNDGPSAATGVHVHDLLPSGYSYVSNTPSQGSYVSGTGIWMIGTINDGGNATLDLTATVLATGDYKNVAQVSAANETDADSTPNNDDGDQSEDDEDAENTTPTPIIDLELEKDVDHGAPPVGSNVTFTITLDNKGLNQATGVAVKDLLPSGFSYISSTPSRGSYVSGTGIWTVGTVNAGNSATLDIVAQVLVSGDYKNIAEVSAANETDVDSTPNNDDGDQSEDDEDAAMASPTASIDLETEKIVDNATPDVGTNVIFTMTVENRGPSTATGVEVVDLLPSGYGLVAETPSQGSYDDGTGVWTIGTINAGNDATLDIEALVLPTGDYKNVAQVSAANETDIDSIPNNDDGDQSEDDEDFAQTTPNPIIDLELSKIVDVLNPIVGSNVTFTITVNNDGPSAATGVHVHDLLPSGYSYVSNTPSQGSYVSGTGIWMIGTINDGGNATLDLTATVLATGDYKNVAQVSAANETDADSTPNNDDGDQSEDDEAAATTSPVTVIDLELEKTVDDATPNAGTNIVFTITVENQGPNDATGVAVTDSLPSGFSYVSHTPSQGTYDDGTGVWSVGALANGTSASLEITATVEGSGNYKNVAQVSAANETDADSTPNNDDGDQSEDDEDAESVIPTPIIDLELEKTVDNTTPNVGTNVTFTITTTNNGPSTATGVQTHDLLPSGYSYVSSAPSQGTYSNVSGVWNVGSLNDGVSATLDLTATVLATGDYKNISQVSAANETDVDSTPNNDDGDQGEDDEDAENTTPVPIIDLSLNKYVDDSNPDVGGTIIFTNFVANNGPSQATGVEVEDILPTGYTYVSNSPDQGTYDNGTGIWAVGTMNAGENATLQISATVNDTGEYKNVAQVHAANEADLDSTPNNDDGDQSEDDEDSAPTSPSPVADLQLDKTVNSPTPLVGTDVIFTITLANDGPSEGTGIEVSDVLPAGYSYVSNIASQGTYDEGIGVWTVGTVPNGGTATLDITATVEGSGNYYNVAQVRAANEEDPDSAPNNDDGDQSEDDEDAATTSPLPVIDLELEKTVDDETPNVGTNVTFTIAITNEGPSTATDVLVEDLLASGYDDVSNAPSQGVYTSTSGIWDVGALSASETATLTITANVLAEGVYENVTEVVEANETDSDSTPNNDDGDQSEDDEDAAAATPVPIIDLSIVKMVDNPTPLAGENVLFTITASNSGPSHATGVKLEDIYPTDYTVVGSTASQGSYDVYARVWDIGTLPRNATVTLMLTMTAHGSLDPDGEAAQKSNTAEIVEANEQDLDSTPNNDDGDQSEDDEDRATATLKNAGTIIIEKVADPGTGTIILPGDILTYSIRYFNNGENEYTGVTFTDALDSSIEYIEGSIRLGEKALTDESDGDEGTYSKESRKVNIALNSIAKRSEGAFTFRVRVRDLEFSEKGVPNVARMMSNETGTMDTNSTFHPVDSITIVKTSEDINGGQLEPGDTIQWTVKINNIGLTKTTNVIITDDLPGEVTYIKETITGRGADDSGAPKLLWRVGVLELDEEVSVGFETRVNDDVPNGTRILNQAVVDSNESLPKKSDDPKTPEIDDATLLLAKSGVDLRIFIILAATALVLGIAFIVYGRRLARRTGGSGKSDGKKSADARHRAQSSKMAGTRKNARSKKGE